MGYDLDSFIDPSGTNSIKWEFMSLFAPNATEKAIPMWVADMDFPCAEPILAALHRRVDRQIFGYSTHRTAEYFRAVCGWYQHRFNWYVNSTDLVYSPGVVPALSYLIHILTEPGDGVIIQRPVYAPFSSVIEKQGRTLVNNPLVNRGGYYVMDFDDLERKAKEPGTKLMLLCSPHNPVGRVWKGDELKKLGQICLENDLLIISDEIHCDLVRKGIKHTPLVTLFPEHKNKIITATAPSKTFNIAGMHLSNIIIHDRKIREKWLEYVSGQLRLSAPDPLAIVAAQAAYCLGEEWLEEVLAYLDNNISFLESYLQEHLPEARCTPLEGTYLAWVDLRAYGYTQEELKEKILEEAQVLIEEGTIFGEEGKGFIRINIACPINILKEGLKRIAGVLNPKGKEA
mgnify:CR=1 FL=1